MRKLLFAHHKAQKSSKNFKPGIHNVVATGANFAKKYGLVSLCLLAELGSQDIVVKYTAPTGLDSIVIFGNVVVFEPVKLVVSQKERTLS